MRRLTWVAAALLMAVGPVAVVSARAQGAAPVATAGEDTLIGGPGPDTLAGFAGADVIRGMDGPDSLNGNAGPDTVGGGPGPDLVHGGQGDDRLNGGQGDDTVVGDLGDDTETGGLGADRFVITPSSGRDLITDFSSAEGDRIELPAEAGYTLLDQPEGVAIRLQTGEQVRLAGVRTGNLGDWLVLRSGTATSTPPVAPAPSRRPLELVIAALVGAFLVLLALGLRQLFGRKPG